MSAALVVLIFVAAGDASDGATIAARAAAQDALGPQTIVVVRDVADTPSDAQAIAAQGAVGADALVEIHWVDEARDHARVRVHVAGGASWSERELAFATTDPPLQRGRAIAFTIASMVPATKQVVVTPPPKPPTPAPPPPPIDALPPRAKATPSRFFFDARGAALPNRGVSEFGGVALVGVRPVPQLSANVGAGARFGEAAAASATLSTYVFGAGVAWAPLSFSHVWVGARAGLWAQRHLLSQPGGATGEARWVSAATFAAEMGVRPTESGTEIVLGLGVETMFRTVDFVVDGAHVGALPSTRFVVELGIRAPF